MIRILEETRNNRVSWDVIEAGRADSYAASWPKYSFKLWQWEEEFQSGISGAIVNEDGVNIVVFAASDGDPDWDLMCAIFNEARMRALGIDKALEYINRELDLDIPFE